MTAPLLRIALNTSARRCAPLEEWRGRQWFVAYSWEDEAALAATMAEVDAAEAAGAVGPWPYDDAPARLLEEPPPAGTITSRTDLPDLGATELVLSNGMKARPPVLSRLTGALDIMNLLDRGET